MAAFRPPRGGEHGVDGRHHALRARHRTVSSLQAQDRLFLRLVATTLQDMDEGANPAGGTAVNHDAAEAGLYGCAKIQLQHSLEHPSASVPSPHVGRGLLRFRTIGMWETVIHSTVADTAPKSRIRTGYSLWAVCGETGDIKKRAKEKDGCNNDHAARVSSPNS